VKAKRVRLILMGVGVLALLCLFEVRAFYLQTLSRDRFLQRAKRQYYARVVIPSKRGRIMDREGRVMAVSLLVPSLYAVPFEVTDKGRAARLLSEVLQVSPSAIEGKLSSNRHFVWIKRHASPQEFEKVRELGIRGIDAVKEPKRFYPYRELASPLLGFVGVDHQGLEGLERAYDKWLRAPAVEMVMERDALGRLISLPLEPDTGGPWDLRLTLDVRVQYILEKELERGMIEAQAKRAVGVIIDPFTGEILAMASLPSFNPNCFSQYPPERWKNLCTMGLFEPGSVLKPFLIGAALQEGIVGRNDVLFCEGGRYHVGPVTVRDVKAYEWLTVEEILQFSSNIGAAKVARAMGAYRYYRYLRAFGFGRATGVGVPEEEGILRPPRNWTLVDLVTLGFGQGMVCTPLQLAVAYSVIANGGVRVNPYVVKEMVRVRDGKRRASFPQPGQRVLSRETCRVLMEMLERVVAEGTGKKASLEGYPVAGKTGTSQKYDPEEGRYSRERFVASFVGILPSRRPRAVVVIMLDEPKRSIYGGEVAAPIFKGIARELVQYWGLPRRGKMTLLADGRSL